MTKITFSFFSFFWVSINETHYNPEANHLLFSNLRTQIPRTPKQNKKSNYYSLKANKHNQKLVQTESSLNQHFNSNNKIHSFDHQLLKSKKKKKK